MSSQQTPYLSVVVASRNDNHGGDLNRRMQIFINALAEQCRRFALAVELIIVEWNPPDDRLSLADEFTWPEWGGQGEVRIIRVPAELHQKFNHADQLPLFQMIAKNVGIRRARGQYVLATNIDLIFSDELMRFLAVRRLKSGVYYRLDRYDVTSDVPLADVQAQLLFCETHLIRICKRYGIFDVVRQQYYWIYPPSLRELYWYHSNTGHIRRVIQRELEGTSQLLQQIVLAPFGAVVKAAQAAQMVWSWRHMITDCVNCEMRKGLILAKRISQKLYRYMLHPSETLTKLTRPMTARILYRKLTAFSRRIRRFIYWRGLWMVRRLKNVSRRIVVGSARVLQTQSIRMYRRYLTFTAYAYRVRAKVFRTRQQYLRPKLHTNACGDFTLMARDDWFALRGYPELEIFSMHIDSLMLYIAHYHGLREAFLPPPMVAYHIDHGGGWSPEGAKALDQRLLEHGIPQIVREQFDGWVLKMAEDYAPIMFNDEKWGLADELLVEDSVEKIIDQ
ncbi:MAG: hypothetical protein H7175_24210 [Burkholderiales bacterium]|nr:hypothetical protein [Anaerolineae bacterium]